MSIDTISDNYFHRDEYGNLLASADKRSPYRYIFNRQPNQAVAVTGDPAYSDGYAPATLVYHEGRLVKRTIPQMGTITLSGRRGQPVELVDEWNYAFYPSGELRLKLERGFENGQRTSIEETHYSPEGLELVQMSRDQLIGSSRTRYDQYVLDEHSNWVSRQRCSVRGQPEQWAQQPEQCTQEQRVITYY